MALKILSYHNGNDLKQIINTLLKNSGENSRFVIPSRKDKSWWYKITDAKNLNHDYEVWTWQNIYLDIMNSSSERARSVLSPPDHLMILKNILAYFLDNLPEKTKAWPGLKRSGFAEVLSNDIRELLNENVKPENLETLKNQNDPSGFLLPEVYANYIDYLEDNNLIDSAQIYTAALNAMKNNSKWGRDLKIIFIGFLSFNHAQLELVRELQKRAKEIVIIKPEAELKNFHDITFQFGGDEIFNFDNYDKNSAKISKGTIFEIPVAEPALEPEIIARILALWAAGEENIFDFKFNSFDEVGLMIPENYKYAVENAFKRYQIPFNPDNGVQISNTLPGLVLNSIENLKLRNFPTYETALLLSQKIFAGDDFNVNLAYRAGAYGLSSKNNRKTWLDYLRSTGEDKALLAIQAIKKFSDALSRRNTPAKIMNAFYEFLTTPGLWLDNLKGDVNYPELDETIRQTASAIKTVHEKVIALHELTPDLGAFQDIKLENSSAFDFLDTWCKNSLTRAPIKTNNAVSIFTGTPPVLSSFPVWIMAGVTQKTWSGNIQSSQLLGNTEREKLSQNEIYIPNLQDKANQREALFRRLVHIGEKLTIITRPELDDDKRPVAQSNFMLRFPDDFQSWKIKTWPQTGIDILSCSDDYIFDDIETDYDADKLNRFAPILESNIKTIGASDLKSFLTCPLKYYLNKHANLYPVRNELVSPLDFGNMAHKFWEQVWSKFRTLEKLDGENFRRVAFAEWEILTNKSDANNNVYEKFIRLVKDFRLKRLLEGQKFRIERLINIQAEIIDGLHKNGFIHEKILLEDEAQLSHEINGVKFLGQCDRIEILHQKSTGSKFAVITDYKEGNSKSSEKSFYIKAYAWNYEKREKFQYGLQISAYALLFSHCYPKINLGGAYFLGLNDGKLSGSMISELETIFEPYSDSLNRNIEPRQLESLYAMECAAMILNSETFHAFYIDKQICSWCGLKTLCRRGEIKGESFSDDDNSSEDEQE